MSKITKFDTGATRDTQEGKPDYEGYLSPLVLWAFGQYMLKHQVQHDGQIRTSDNWQRGIPKESYMKSLFRHFMDLWLYHRGFPEYPREEIKDALCGILFNCQGYLHELLKAEASPDEN